jgi:multiple sugar transport system ATP-binding protein
VWIRGDGFEIQLAGEKAKVAARHTDKKVILGVRPSDLTYAPDAPAGESLTLDVLVSEYIGAQSVLMCNCGSNRVTVEVNSETPMALGETLKFQVNLNRVHLFDVQTEEAL